MQSRSRIAQRVAEITPRVLPSLVVLELDDRLGAGFVVREDGLIFTCLHVVSGESSITARFADGSDYEVFAVAAVDPLRDLAVLRIEATGLPTIFEATRPMAEGMQIFVPRAEESTLALHPNRLGPVRAVVDTLAVFTLGTEWDATSSGAPVLDEYGCLLGAAGAMPSDKGPVAAAIPLRYIKPLLSSQESLPMSALAQGPRRRRIRRSIPDHPVSLLEGCDPEKIRVVRTTLVAAINLGAPTYNRGDFEGCVRVYHEVARRMMNDHADCPGVGVALQEGIDRAATLSDLDAKAWAMRDTIDGLLHVIDRYLDEEDAPPSSEPDKNRVLN
jgi:hypothetical protein